MRFDPGQLTRLDEPVQRWLTHAIAEGTELPRSVALAMRGRIKADVWLPFTAEEEVDGRSFTWRARVGLGPLTLLRIDDRYARAAGSTEGRLFGRRRLFRSADENTIRSAAGRTALESVVFAPPTVLPERGVAWRAESDEVIVGRFDLPPERPEVEVRIDPEGAVRSVSAMRWGPADGDAFEYVRCGCDVQAERRFGDLTLPSRLTVSWHHDSPRALAFFRAEVTAVEAGGTLRS